MRSVQYFASATRRLVSYSHTPQHSLAGGARHIWRSLTRKDNWQGEFSVALFGAIGWALISFLSDGVALHQPELAILGEMLGPHWWEAWFLAAGLLQLYGLFTIHPWCRAIGAFMIFKGFMDVFLVLTITRPWSINLAAYASCICIEFCAIIFHVSAIVQHRHYPARWSWTFKR